MKIVVVILVTLFSINRNVSCNNLIDYISVKWNDFASSITNTFRSVKERISFFFARRIADMYYKPQNGQHFVLKDNLKRDFSDFVKKATEDSDLDNPDYLNIRCDPTASMSTPQLAMSHGRTVESHIIHTQDGYLLTLHRLSTRPRNRDKSPNNKTVILHHGLLGSSTDWILLGSKQSLPYLLSNAGYDVWMINARGNYYSRGHVTKHLDSYEFWNFSWQEMGEYDLSATIDYIREIKNTTEPINFIGHSMGGTSLLVLLSTAPHYNRYLKMGILIAPIAYMSKVKGPLKVLTTMFSNPTKQLVKLIGGREFVPKRKIPSWLASAYCTGPKLYCSNPLLFLSGCIPQTDRWNASFIAKLVYHVPAGGSTNTILHYAQLVKTGKFHKFNDVSAEFPLKKVTLPIVIISSGDDWLAPTPDILRLYYNIANPIDHYIIRERNLTHTEYVWGYDADALVFSKVLDYLENGLTTNPLKSNEII